MRLRIIKNLRGVKKIDPKAVFFLSGLVPSVAKSERPSFTEEVAMVEHYKVAMHEGQWWVVFKGRKIAAHPIKVTAQFYADRGNLIIQGAEEYYREHNLAGVR